MIQGTGSNVGKSLIVAGLCRAFANRGISVAPFKPQNMSNNAAVTANGGEIGRSQALQAIAARIPAHTDMNPILLKPETETGAQIIVHGKRHATMRAREYATQKSQLLKPALESLARLSSSADLIIVEGAGSPAETNLRDGDIANMGFAEAAEIPVVLIGDIHRGGVIAQLVGTKAVLSNEDGGRIKAFAINKFHGDPSLFQNGMDEIANRTKWDSLGLIPWFADSWKLPAEDVMDIVGRTRGKGNCKIAVPRLGRIANFDDLDPLSAEPEVSVEIVESGRALPGDAILVLIPGSKSTIADLREFRRNGWDIDLRAHIRRGGHVLGICGGYQMLGRKISDPQGIEGPATTIDGLGFLDVSTIMVPEKRLSLASGIHKPTGEPVTGYEIHIGKTEGPDCTRAWLEVDGRNEGAASVNGRIRGCYIHGLFAADGFRASYLQELGTASSASYTDEIDITLDSLADHLENSMDLNRLHNLSSAFRQTT